MWTRRRFSAVLSGALSLMDVSSQAASPSSAVTEMPDDPLAAYREQFKLGMDRYKTGALAEAIGYWEPIYRDLGEQTGYRLAFNLGIAYAELGDATRAAEHLQAFLSEVDARRGRGEPLAEIVEREATEAHA